MRARLPEGGPSRSRLQRGERPAPADPAGHLPRRPRAAADHRLHLGQPLVVMLGQHVEPLVQAIERPLVTRQHQMVRVAAEALERGREVGERVSIGVRSPRDVGRDPGQHVIPGEQQPPRAVDDAQMAGSMAGGVQDRQLAACSLYPCTVGQLHVGPHGRQSRAHVRRVGGQAGELRRRAAAPAQPAGHRRQVAIARLVVGRHVRHLGGMHRDPGAGRGTQPGGEAEMVRVEVRHDGPEHVGQARAGRAQARHQGIPRLVRVPAEIDQDHAAAGLDAVAQRVPQRVGERDRDAPHPRGNRGGGRHASRRHVSPPRDLGAQPPELRGDVG